MTNGAFRPVAADRSRPAIADATLAAAVFLVAATIGWLSLHAMLKSGKRMEFYQVEFGPAVMLGCHRGYANPVALNIPAMQAFLHERSPSFECASLPPSPPLDPTFNTFHRTARYLLLAVGLLWRMTGVSWSAVPLFSAVLFGVTSMASYGIARLAMGRILSLAVALAVTGSTLNLIMMRFLRDYAKAPFMLVSIFLMGATIALARTSRAVWWLAVLGGVCVGIGFGFRNDLLLVIPPFLFTLFCLVRPDVATMRARAIACALFVAAFVVSAYPVLADYSGGSNTGHVTVLGLTTSFTEELRVIPARYDFGYHYLDTLGDAIVTTYADRVTPTATGVGYLTPDYDRAAVGYLWEVAKRCPADLIVRAYAAVARIPVFFLEEFQYPPAPGRVAELLYRVRARVNEKLSSITLFALLIGITLVAVIDLRAASFVAVVLCLLGATAVQFHVRHFFYFEFVPWWTFGWIATALLAWRKRIRAGDGSETATSLHAIAGVAAICLLCLGLWGVLVVARSYQARQLTTMFEAVERAPRMPLPLVPEASSAGRVLLKPESRPMPHAGNDRNITYQYVAIELDPSTCPSAPDGITVVYDAPTPDVNLSEELPVQPHPAGSPIRVFFPVYERAPGFRFRGLEVDASAERCVSTSLVQTASEFPLLLTVDLSPGWRKNSLYQRLGGEPPPTRR